MIILQLNSEELKKIISDSVESTINSKLNLNQISKFHEGFQLKHIPIKEASKILNLAIPTIYSKCSRGQLPYMKKGKKLYFSKDELENYLKSGKVFTNDEIIENASNYLQKKAEQ